MKDAARLCWMVCALRRLLVFTLLPLAALRFGPLLARTGSEDELWQQLQSQRAVIFLNGSVWAWRGDRRVSLSTSVIINGPGTIILETAGIVITGSGSAASLTLRNDVTLFYRSSILNGVNALSLPASSGPIPAFNGSNLSLTFANVTVMAPLRTLSRVASFWSSSDVLVALEVLTPDDLGTGARRLASYTAASGRVSISGLQLLPSDTRPAAVDCFSGGLPVTDSASMRGAMDRSDVPSVFVYQDIAMVHLDFNYSRPVSLTSNRSLELYGCPGTTLNTNNNWTRFGVQVSRGGSLALRGLTLTDVTLVNQLFWPRFLAPLLGMVYVGVGGGCSIANSTIISPNATDLRAYLGRFASGNGSLVLPPAARPEYVMLNATTASIARWRMSGIDAWQQPLGISPEAAAASYWYLEGVVVAAAPQGECLSPTGVQGVNVDSGARFRDLIKDEMIPALRIMADITLLPSEWPPAVSGPAQGQIFVNGSKEVYACHPMPGERYTIDWGNIGQVVFVFGNLTFSGSLLMTNPLPSPRRSYLYLLLGALSVETNGVIQFNGVEIHGNTSSPFTNAADSFWEYQSNCRQYCAGFIPPPGSYINVSYYDAFIFQYRFNKTEWVAVSQGRNISGTGYWGYTDVALTWRPETRDGGGGRGVPVAAIAVPVAVGGFLLIAGVGGLVLWLRRRAAAQAAAAASAVPYHKNSEASCSAVGGEQLRTTSQLGQKDGSTQPQGGSYTANPIASAAISGPAGATSTTFSQGGTSVLSASAPTEARIENMRRAITAQNVLTGSHRNEQITLTELLGEGTFGKVYRGTWRGTTVAVKTMVLPTNMSGKEKREKMAVMETAISSSLSHPNIVQTYTYAVLPVKGDVNEMDNKLGAGASMTVDSTSPLASMTTTEAQNVHSWEVRLVLEFCDRGSLRDVLNDALLAALRTRGAADADAPADEDLRGEGAAARQQPQQPAVGADAAGSQQQPAQRLTSVSPPQGPGSSAAGGVSRESCPLGYLEVLDTCLDVARAMLHMHSENIVHGDLKARNILLKTGGVGDGRSYVAKVADFGLSLRIDPHETHVSNVYQGTITHMAPEVLLHGKVSKMSDVYAFAILMWEAYTAGQAFKGTPRALLGHEVTKMNRRPPFPMDTPFEFQLLACRCWESDPAIRPTFDQIIGELSRMRAKLAGGGPGAGAPAAMGPSLSGSLAAPAAASAAAGGGVAAVPPPGGGGAAAVIEFTDSLMTASTAAQPMVPAQAGTGGGGGGLEQHPVLGAFGGGGVAMAPSNSVTLNSETGSTGQPESALAHQGLFLVGGVDGSTWVSQSMDGMNASPGTFTIGARPPFLGGGPLGRPPPPLPPILEMQPVQQQQ